MGWDASNVKVFQKLRRIAAPVCATLLLISLVEARNKKGDKFLKLGQKAEAQKDYDAALNYYDQAVATEPREPAYLLPDQNVRLKASETHVSEGRKLQKAQKLQEALVQFQKAFLADPSSQIALQEIQQTTAMIREREKAPPGTPILTPAEKAQREMEQRISSLEAPPTLRPITNQISSLKMNNQPARVLYESVCKLAGINVLFDPTGIDTGTTRNFNLDLNNVTLEEALNYVSLVTHTFWKPISRNAIFVTQETEPKRQEYQDEVVKVFYIQNASTPQEFTEIFNAIRQGAKLNTGVYQVASQNAIVAKGTTDTIALVEKLVHDLDRPKAEVLVDVIVLEVSKSKMTTLGAALAGQTGGLNVPIQFTPRNPVLFGNTSTSTTTTTFTTTGTTTSTTTGTTTSTTTSTTTGTTTSTITTTFTTTGTSTGTSTSTTTGTSGITTTSTTTSTTTTTTTTTTTAASSGEYIALSQVGHVSTGDFSISLPGALVQALLTDSSSRILQRPQVRATDGGKASLKIGSKIPYVSGSLNSAVATPGAIPYATTQFQQVDVGTQIDLEPHVNGPTDISMHIKVEVSDVTQTETIAGVQQPIISQRVDEANIRMKDGEVSVLGGLYDDETDLSVSGIPGVTNIPILGYLFGTKTKNQSKDEVLIAMIPHIIRAPDMSAMGEEPVLAGSERTIRVQRKPDGSAPDPLPAPRPDTVPTAPAPPLSPVPNRPSQTSLPGAGPSAGTGTPFQQGPAVAPGGPPQVVSPQSRPAPRQPGQQPPSAEVTPGEPPEPK
jgi:general secretion pathway protein D